MLKRLASALLSIALLFALCAPVAAAPAPSGYALYSDIVAKINGHALRSYNVHGCIAVVAEDLRGYGFRVDWNAAARTLRIDRAEQLPDVWPDYVPPVNTHRAGEIALVVYPSDIKVYVGDASVESFNVSGQTLVLLRSLAAFGRLDWYASAHVSNLTLGETSAPLARAVPAKAVPANPISASNHKLYILMYHRIVEGDAKDLNDWTTTTELLRKDLQWLLDNGYVCYLPSVLAAGAPLAERSVLITFDDGYEDNYRLAFPLLQEYGMKAVISLMCGPVERGEEGFLTWDMCREMAVSGLIEFGSHTYDLHDGIPDKTPDGILRLKDEEKDAYLVRVGADLRKSVELLQRETGRKPVFLAYPHGLRDAWAADLVKQTFAMTVTTRHGAADTANGLYGLPRCNINSRQPVSMFLPRAK